MLIDDGRNGKSLFEVDHNLVRDAPKAYVEFRVLTSAGVAKPGKATAVDSGKVLVLYWY